MAERQNLGVLKEGWFSEVHELWPGQCMSLEVETVLFDGTSEYQHVQVLQSKTWGKVLVLDGVIQLTEKDEFSYQECIANIPMHAHPDPKSVCIIGGGDGGVLGQLILHRSVTKIVMCEIDEMVIEQSKQHFPKFHAGWNDPRFTLHKGDGAAFLAAHENEFDVIIVDSSDPDGPAESLFTSEFIQTLHRALRDGGIACTQAECIWLHLDLIGGLVKAAKSTFPNADYASCGVPTYPCGQIGFLLLSKGESARTPKGSPEERLGDGAEKLQYYTPSLHCASFALPRFVEKKLAEVSE